MTEPSTMKDVIDKSGVVTRFRWGLFRMLSHLLYGICPEPHRSYMRAIWAAKMGEFTKAADRLTDKS